MIFVAVALAVVASVLAVYGSNELAVGGGQKLMRRQGKYGIVVSFLVRLGRRVQRTVGGNISSKRKSIEVKLCEAGLSRRISAIDFLALKVGSAAATLVSSGIFTALAPGRLLYLFAVIGPVAAFFLPDWLLYRVSSRRKAMIVSELPDFLDLMCISVGAGTPIHQALELVTTHIRGPLGMGCDRLVHERRLGVQRGDTLLRLSERIGVTEVDRFVTAYARAERLGVTVSESLARQADAMRDARVRAVQERAARAGPKIQLVVALVLVPAVLLLFASAILGQLLGGSAGSAIFG